MNRLRGFGLIIFLAIATASYALDEREPFADPERQALYENLNNEIRCLVCQNQTIADSSAPLAADLRREVWEMVDEGRNEAQIKQFLTERYGDFVLYKPRFDGPAIVLWAAPVLFLAFGALVLWRIVRRRAALPISAEAESSSTPVQK